MNDFPLLIAALVLFPAIGAAVWGWWTLKRAEDDLLVSAGLHSSDFDIGIWPR
jgi:hypothetical protein